MYFKYLLMLVLVVVILTSGCTDTKIDGIVAVDPADLCGRQVRLACVNTDDVPANWSEQAYKTVDGLLVSCEQIMSCASCAECVPSDVPFTVETYHSGEDFQALSD
ncbi:MAG: hypothetical protein KKC05_03590, partial [Nanoarchaeota archaeon]|nr:hypothetical protein [Nanoarchaeota archaeon]